MTNHNLDNIDMSNYEDLEISELVTRFKVYKTGRPLDLCIDILYNSKKTYTGVANYAYKGPKQVNPYRSTTDTSSSIEEAFHDAIRGIKFFYQDTYEPSKVIRKRNDGKQFDGDLEEIFDGDLEEIN